ncbi:MAG: ABC transporter permease [Gemmatimonadota bacterium]
MGEKKGAQKRDLQALAGRGRAETDLDEEIRFHLERRIEENLARGMSEAEARAEAERRFGDVARVRSETRRVHAALARERGRRERILEANTALRLALRSLARRPALGLSVVGILSLGLGASAAVFTALNRIVLQPLSFPRAAELVWIDSAVPYVGEDARWGLSVAGYFEFAERASTLTALGAYSGGDATVIDERGPKRARIGAVTASLLRVLEARPALGRLLLDEDDRPGSAPVVVLGHAFWVAEYGSDPGVLGRTLQVNGTPFEIVGVLESGVTLPQTQPDLWLALGLDPAARPVNAHWLSAVGRLSPAATVEDAQRELSGITDSFVERFPSAYSVSFMRESGFNTLVQPLKSRVLGDVGRVLWILFGSVGLLLAITLANVGNLMVVRAEGRRRELAVRSALGASDWNLFGLHLAESVVLALLAVGPALLLAAGGVRVLVRLAPAGLPRLSEVALGPSTAAFTASLAMAAGLALGVLPGYVRAIDPRGALGGLQRAFTPTRQVVRRVLVIAQVGLAVVLLTAAGLMLRSFLRLRAVDPGFQMAGVVTFTVPLPPARYGAYQDVSDFHRRLLSEIERLPGVVAAGSTTRLPVLDENGGCASLFVEDQPPDDGDQPPCLPVQLVTPGYVEAMGIPMQAGASLSWADLEAGTGEVLVTAALAHRFWGRGDAVGMGVRGNGWERPFYRVKGVTGDVRADGLDRPPLEAVYFPMIPLEGAPLWSPPRTMSVAVRSERADPVQLVPAVRAVLSAIDPDVPLVDVQALDQGVQGSAAVARTSFTLVLLGVAGALALLLSAVGLYAVLAVLVAQRTAELGVRMALGALPGQVIGLVLRQSLGMALVGVGSGVVVASLSARWLAALLFEVRPHDPWTLLGAGGGLLLVTLIAALVPAWRAARLDPKVALLEQ